jgi:geranylgeranyl diphosphate synthase, type I
VPAEYPELRGCSLTTWGGKAKAPAAEAQGKRIRPLLVLLSAEAAGGPWRKALPSAAAVELLHNFSLVHDDIQDQSPLRRSRPTVWVKWGIAQAINAGDVLFTLSFLSLQRLLDALPSEDVLLSSRLLQQTCLRLTEGQYLDISYEKRNLPMEAYWPMIGGKTAALISCCTELGAVAAGADEHRRAAFHAYGDNLGLAFQVLDDWLGIWGDAGQTGKSVESDLASGKKTLPVLYAIGKDGRLPGAGCKGHHTR